MFWDDCTMLDVMWRALNWILSAYCVTIKFIFRGRCCNRWFWFEARSKLMLGGETCKVTWERISLVYYTLVHCECELILILWLCLSREGSQLAFSSGYNDNVSLLGTAHSMPFKMHQHTAVSLRRGEAVKLEGWLLDCLAGTGVNRLKGKCDGNKEV